MRRVNERHLLLEMFVPPLWLKEVIGKDFVRCTCGHVSSGEDTKTAVANHKEHVDENA